MSDKKTVALFGYGYWGKKLYSALKKQGYRVVVVEKKALPVGLTRFSKSRVLGRPDIQQCFLATPEETHFQLAEECLLAGKHVFVEKPLCLTFREARRLTQLAGRQKVTVYVDTTFLFSPVLPVLKRLLISQKFGRLQSVFTSRFSVGITDKKVPVTDDLAIHDITILQFLLGPLTVTRAQLFSVRKVGTADLAHIQWKVRKVPIFSSYSWVYPQKERTLIFRGTKQTVQWSTEEAKEVLTVFNRNSTTQKTISSKTSPLEKSVQFFFRLCRTSPQAAIFKKQHSQYAADVRLLETIRTQNNAA